MVVVDGDSGSVTWSHSVPCHMKETPATSAVTSDQKSVFLFWAEGLSPASLHSVSEPGEGVPLSLCEMAAALWGQLGVGGVMRPVMLAGSCGEEEATCEWAEWRPALS